MSPKRRKARHDVEDQTTSRFESDAVPAATVEDDDVTAPVAASEMKAVARASRLVRDPQDAVPPARGAVGPNTLAPEQPAGLFAEVQIAGSKGDVLRLAAKNLTASGVALELPDADQFVAPEGTAVMVVFQVGRDSDGSPRRARIGAQVAHVRPGNKGKPGGVALRWNLHENDQVIVDQILTWATSAES